MIITEDDFEIITETGLNIVEENSTESIRVFGYSKKRKNTIKSWKFSKSEYGLSSKDGAYIPAITARNL